MKPKSEKGKGAPSKKNTPASTNSATKKGNKNFDEEEELEDEDLPPQKGKSKPGKKAVSKDTDEGDSYDEEIEDDWNKTDEDDFDPDFEEFDMPGTRGKKPGKKGIADDDFDPEEDFKSMGLFDDENYDDEDDDDF